MFGFVRLFVRFKDPRGGVFVHFIPPSETHQQAARDIFGDPKVGRQQENDNDGQRDKIGTAVGCGTAFADKGSSEKVQGKGQKFEGQMENYHCGMRGCLELFLHVFKGCSFSGRLRIAIGIVVGQMIHFSSDRNFVRLNR